MSKMVDQFVLECDSCQRRKRGTEFRAPLGTVRQPSQPFQYCHMDSVGSFALSQIKNRYIMTFIDQLAKYVEAIAIPEAMAVTCARAYATQIVTSHGSGQTIVTDRGTSFPAIFKRGMYNFACSTLHHFRISPSGKRASRTSA
jgi:hypothetical protein